MSKAKRLRNFRTSLAVETCLAAVSGAYAGIAVALIVGDLLSLALYGSSLKVDGLSWALLAGGVIGIATAIAVTRRRRCVGTTRPGGMTRRRG